jgi:hypothetical protein
MYTTINFKTKKEFKEAVAQHVANGSGVAFYQPGPFGGKEPTEGEITVEGPHYPLPHRWYARCKVRGG